ncbi:MAG TPA: MarR family transcriptional regulator [Vineibacter sp.]|nr:MarR family transcriptional regulator [Vineibacter sp.]
MPAQRRVVTLIALLRRTTQLMVAEITKRLEAAGFTDVPPSFHPIFENIDPDGTRLTVLAARAGLTHQSIGEVVGELERRGYLERVPDPSDGRARLVRLTGKGRALVRAALQEMAAIEATWRRRWRRAGLKGDLRGPLEVALHEADG